MVSAGLLTRWVSYCVVRACRAPSVPVVGPLMGTKPQRAEVYKLDQKVERLQAELRCPHMHIYSIGYNTIVYVFLITLPVEETSLSVSKMFYRLTEELTKENVMSVNKIEADPIFYHLRQAVREGYIYCSEIFLDMSCGNLVKSSSTVIAVH